MLVRWSQAKHNSDEHAWQCISCLPVACLDVDVLQNWTPGLHESLCGMQGMPWDCCEPSQRALKHKLKSALDQIHAAGVLHRDLHEGNILVTPDHRVLVLDFAGAQMNPTQELVDLEMEFIGLTS